LPQGPDFGQGRLRSAAGIAAIVENLFSAADALQVGFRFGAKAVGHFGRVIPEQYPSGQDAGLAAGEAADDIDLPG